MIVFHRNRSVHGSSNVVLTLSQTTQACDANSLANKLFCDLRPPSRRHSTWTPQRLTYVALLMTFCQGSGLKQSFELAEKRTRGWFVGGRACLSYTGFTKALDQHWPWLVPALKKHFQALMKSFAGDSWRCGIWLAIAVDGTRLEASRTKENELGLGRAGREKTGPQVMMTTLWHLGLGMPWDYRLGPGTDSERHHMRDMIWSLPPQSLLIGDAGFIGYDLCCELHRNNHAFLLRIGGNKRLLDRLHRPPTKSTTIVYYWPQARQNEPPLKLRLIVIGPGKKYPVYLVTNVLDQQLLTKTQAKQFYKQRWGQEVYHRSYKQTLGHGFLRSRTPDRVIGETHAAIFSIWLLGLLSLPNLLKRGRKSDEWSVADSRDVVQFSLENDAPHKVVTKVKQTRREQGRPQTARIGLKDLFAECVIHRPKKPADKTARNYPRKKNEPPASPPKIQTPSLAEITRSLRIKPYPPLRLTA